ncbi:MAG: hypothetical protein J2P54_05645, partial [Bradyrhizobiaceae bacterium]|nr:hypothetical protein [Bradyrhizobiaceae bacterium]
MDGALFFDSREHVPAPLHSELVSTEDPCVVTQVSHKEKARAPDVRSKPGVRRIWQKKKNGRSRSSPTTDER